MLKLINIKKSYGENLVLDGVNIEIKPGEIYGLIGSNGAGKSTLFNIIAQILEYNDGEIYYNNKKINSIGDWGKKLGYIIDIPALFEYMTAKEYLEFIYSSSECSKEETQKIIIEVLEKVGLKDVMDKKIKEFSRGMRQRMGIASGIIFDPDIIIMDEPTSALDPIGRMEIHKIIYDLKNAGKTIILSTHILNDIEKTCNRVGLLINGKIKYEGNINDILNNYSKNTLRITCEKISSDEIIKLIKSKKLSNKFEYNPTGLEISFKDNNQKQQILLELVKSKIEFNGFSLQHISLDEIFLNLNKEGK